MSTRKLHALAATARIANIPSVVSNVSVGIFLAWHMGADPAQTGIKSALLVISGIGLYVAGNFLNDWWDRDWDAQRRPERALPSGLFPPWLYAVIAGGFALLGLGLAAAAGRDAFKVAALLVGMILIYTAIHKRSALSVVPMGCCRALLPVLGIAGLFSSPGFVWPAAFGLWVYIAGLSLSARFESRENPPGWARALAGILLVMPVVLIAGAEIGWKLPWHFIVAGTLPYLIWVGLCQTRLLRPPQVHVSGLLAGIPLVDWILLMPIALNSASRLHSWPPWVLAAILIPPVAFVSGRLLQRLAPAT